MKKRKSKELVEMVGISVANPSGSVHSFLRGMTPEESRLDKEATAHLNKVCSRCGSHTPMWGKKLCKQCLSRCNNSRKVADE